MKNLINKIFLWMGYVPVDSTPLVVKEKNPITITVMQAERILEPIAFTSKFALDDYMNSLLRDMRHEIADKSSDMFEVIREVGLPPVTYQKLASFPDRHFIKLRLNIVPPSIT